MANISLDEVRSLVSGGGWQVRVGRKAPVQPQNLVVCDMTVHERFIHFHCGNSVVEVKNDRLTFDMEGGDRPREIEISGPSTVKQQRKKSEGGGWHDVEQIGRHLSLVNVAAEAEYVVAETERVRLANIEERIRCEKERTCAEEEKAANISRFLARQKERIGNARVVDLISSYGGNLEIKFDNGHTLDITGTSDWGENDRLSVGDGKEMINLDSGDCSDQ